MEQFTTQILKFEQQGDKTGWTYIEIPADVAQKLYPGNKKSFRVKGFLDNFSIAGVALLPMGEGTFILPLNAMMRKGIKKKEGALVNIKIEVDRNYKLEVPSELQEYLDEDLQASEFFQSLPKSHRDYFIKWIESAKTVVTRDKRLVETAKALANKMRYNEMIRAQRNVKE